jgi:hypothetical protein
LAQTLIGYPWSPCQPLAFQRKGIVKNIHQEFEMKIRGAQSHLLPVAHWLFLRTLRNGAEDNGTFGFIQVDGKEDRVFVGASRVMI